jgi:apolipoprotein N-acyltransferase
MGVKTRSGRFQPQPFSAWPFALRLALAAFSGAALALSFTGWYIAAFAWVCVALLMLTLLGARPGVAALCGFLHGLVFVLVSLFWISTVIEVHGGASPAAAIGVLLLVAAAWGVLTSLFAWAVNRLAAKSVARACLAAPFLWVALEFLRGHLPRVGFPWNLLGYPAAANLAFVQLTAITGIFGLSLAVAAYNALLAWTIAPSRECPLRRRFAPLGGATLILAVIALAGPRFVPGAGAAHWARLLQPNLPEEMVYPADWYAAHKSDLQETERISLAPGAHALDLLVWPESPGPFSFQDARYAALANSLARTARVPFLSGVIEWKRDPSGPASRLIPYNSAVLLDAQGRRIFSYDKVHLVPFGEYEPFPLIHRVVTSVSSEVGGFAPGQVHSVGAFPNGRRFGVFVCYEAVFPGEVREFTAHGAELLINLSNDGWFGRSAAPAQHLRMARVRAVENHRWLLRDTNNGYTVSVDPYGRIRARLAPDERSVIDAPYDFRTGLTPYARWGDWIAWLCVVVSALILLSGRSKKRAAARPR